MKSRFVPLSESHIRKVESGDISVKELATKLNITLNKIYHKIYKQEVKVPKLWYKGPKPSQDSLERTRKMVEMRNLGFSYREISERFGISKARTIELLKR